MHMRAYKRIRSANFAASVGADTGRHVNFARVSLCVVLSVVALSLSSCSGRYDPQLYAENKARYLTKPLPKALYVNTQDFAIYPRWGGADVQQMVELAERDCVEGSKKRGSDPGRCTPFYFNEVSLVDPSIYE